MKGFQGDVQFTSFSRLVFAAYFLFMLGFFFIPNAVDENKLFVVAVFIPALLLLPRMLKTLGCDHLLLLIVAYLLWMLLSSFWSESFSLHVFFKTLGRASYIAIFVILTAYIAVQKAVIAETYIGLLGISATIAAIISVPLWYSSQPFPDSRVIGIGILNNPNPSAFFFGFFAILCCKRALEYDRLSLRLIFSFCTVILVAFVFLTQSNTGILATVFSIALLLILHNGSRLLHVVSGLFVAAGALFFLCYSMGILEHPLDVGLSARIPIWEKVIEQIELAPLIGHGYQKQVLLDEQGAPDVANYAHNALLASYRDGGVIAAILHLLILATAFVSAVRVYTQNKDPVYLAYLLFGFICMLVDTDQLITRPRELWIIFWWPLAMILARRIPQQTAVENPGAL